MHLIPFYLLLRAPGRAHPSTLGVCCCVALYIHLALHAPRSLSLSTYNSKALLYILVAYLLLLTCLRNGNQTKPNQKMQ